MTSRKTRSTLNSSRLSSTQISNDSNETTTRLDSSSFVEFRRVSSIPWQNSALSFCFGKIPNPWPPWVCDSNWVVSEIRSMPSVTCSPCDREQENGHIGQDISKAVTSFHKQILPTSTLYHQYLSSTHIIIIIYIILYHTKYIIYTTYVISTLTCFRNRESFCPGDSRNLSVASGYSLRP